jgi:hypothetical protein
MEDLRAAKVFTRVRKGRFPASNILRRARQGFFDILPIAKNAKNITTANTIKIHG